MKLSFQVCHRMSNVRTHKSNTQALVMRGHKKLSISIHKSILSATRPLDTVWREHLLYSSFQLMFPHLTHVSFRRYLRLKKMVCACSRVALQKLCLISRWLNVDCLCPAGLYETTLIFSSCRIPRRSWVKREHDSSLFFNKTLVRALLQMFTRRRYAVLRNYNSKTVIPFPKIPSTN